MRWILIVMCVGVAAWGAGKAPKAAEQKCTSAADCKGMLPKHCQVCGDAGSQCAHFVCEMNACQIVTCEAPREVMGASCKSANDCIGILPKVCKTCTDGGTECMHLVCETGQCKQALCK